MIIKFKILIYSNNPNKEKGLVSFQLCMVEIV